jgi:cell division protease FtsH
MALPERDRYGLTKKQCLAQISMCFGGRIGERLATNEISTGAANDIEKATEIARRMVCEWGMSDDMGPINFSEEQDTVFLGREITRSRNHSEETARRIDACVQKIVESGLKTAEQIIAKHRAALDVVAEALLRYETLTGEEVQALVDGRATPDRLRPEPPEDPVPRRETSAAPDAPAADRERPALGGSTPAEATA